MSKLKIDKDKLKKISNAVKEAEKKTSGEIVTAFIKRSDDYYFYRFVFSIIIGLIYYEIMLFSFDKLESLMKSMFWDYDYIYMINFIVFSMLLIIMLVFFFLKQNFILRFIVLRKEKIRKVHQRALRHFVEAGVYDTRDKTGILIFISEMERRVELIADRGINEKIEESKWKEIVDNIVDGIKQGKWEEHLVESIRMCGELLEKHFPIKPDDTNELKNEIDVLEK